MNKPFTYNATVVKVYDGDTITVDIDLGFGVTMHKQKIRLYGINTPEVRGPEREAGLAVRDWVSGRIMGADIVLETIKKDKKGKYGRWLGIIHYEYIPGLILNLNDELIEQGYKHDY